MYVLGIVGSPRKNGLTAQAIQKSLEAVSKADIKAEILYLSDFHLQPCRDCYPTLTCWENNICYHKDDFKVINEKINDANGLILGSAVYYGDVTRTVDNLMNKKIRYGKDKPQEGIPGLGIAVAGGMGGGYSSALRKIYHFFRLIKVRPLKPIPITRFNLPVALDEVYQSGWNLASIIKKKECLTGPQRVATFLDLPILGFDYLQERIYLVKQVIEGAKREKPSESMEEAVALYDKADDLRNIGDNAGAFTAIEAAYKTATSIWNPDRISSSGQS